MTGNLQAIGFLITWVLGWGIGGSLIDAGLINAGLYSLEGGQLVTTMTLCVVVAPLGSRWHLAVSVLGDRRKARLIY